jgi:orotidine-5'-phosphate decarboxylase
LCLETMPANFADRLHDAIRRKRTAALVGLDPRFERLPAPLVAEVKSRGPSDPLALMARAFEEFCLRIVDVVAPLVPAVKPQAAFFEELGPQGMAALERVIRHARKAGLIVICDAKRGDIGSTAEAYARAYLAGEDPDAAVWASDALTVSPYLGRDTLMPFVNVAQERGAGIYVLVRTSNPEAGTFQDRKTEGVPLYRAVADVVETFAKGLSNGSDFGPVGAVVGATYPAELAELRQAMPHVPLLVPGYGSQGAGAIDVIPAFNAEGLGALVNNSRGINFAYEQWPYSKEFGPDRWEDAVDAATRKMIQDLDTALANAGKSL